MRLGINLSKLWKVKLKMGLFNRKKETEVKIIDMAEDSGRRKFIDEALANKAKEEHIPTDVVNLNSAPPEILPPEILMKKNEDVIRKVVSENAFEEKPLPKIKTETKVEDSNEMNGTLVVKIKSQALLNEMLDGVSEIVKNHGKEAIVHFEIK